MSHYLIEGFALLVMPFLLTGVINRTKSLWSGRRGPPLLQLAYDVLRLLHKSSVYSHTTTPLFRVAPWIFLVSAAGSAAIAPLIGGAPFVSFPFDFVWFAYVWALGRVAIMLAGLDAGSSFEGMGVAREATFATLLEPALFLIAGALCLQSGARTFSGALALGISSSIVVSMLGVIALFVVLQVECARLPIDDPTTHLELTMIHEVMILDHSGPDLAAIQVGSAIKTYVATSVIASLLNPFAGSDSAFAAFAHVGLCIALATVVGTVESLIARLKLRTVPLYIAGAVTSAMIALLATAWRSGGHP